MRINGREFRKSEFSVDDLFIDRWSPRAMSGEEISEEELFSLFEAARWAPSSYNNQPWRFLYGMRDSQNWDRFYNLMGDFNQKWAVNASVLIVVAAKTTFDHNDKPNRTFSFDTGAAWMNLALQGWLKGFVVHAMAGFDYDRAKRDLNVPDGYEVQAMIAVGKPGEKGKLPENIQKSEKPNSRKNISEFVFEGKFES